MKIKCDQLRVTGRKRPWTEDREGNIHVYEWVGALRQREERNKECGYVDEKCTNKCGKQVMRKDMENHLKSCPRRQTSCKYCSATVAWKELQGHYKECPEYPVKCTFNCGETVERCQMAVHVGHHGTCPNSLLDCKLKNMGCPFTGKRSELSIHMTNTIEDHVSLAVNKLVETEQELKELKSKLAFVHTWTIENWSQKMLDVKAGVESFACEPFYVPPGYHVYIKFIQMTMLLPAWGSFFSQQKESLIKASHGHFHSRIRLKLWTNNLMERV
jgi:hypothetical protein